MMVVAVLGYDGGGIMMPDTFRPDVLLRTRAISEVVDYTHASSTLVFETSKHLTGIRLT